MNRLDKSPDDIADAMAERLDNPSMRAESRPEDDPADDIRYGYLLLPAAALAYEYGFGFFTPLLVLWGVTQMLSSWYVQLQLWSSVRPTRVGWGVIAVGLLLGLVLVAIRETRTPII